MDVLDVDWQRMMTEHHAYTLASASIDNLIIVWTINLPDDAMPISRPSSSSLITPNKVLKGHDSYVKGLAFDPLGR